MSYQLPHTIENKYGEKLIFLRMEGNRLIVENFVQPKAGPPMHVHFLQNESLTVVSGKIGYQILGEEPQYGGPGDTFTFKRGVAHRFWNDSDTEVLYCTGWVDPVHNFVFFLTNMYDALDRGGNHRPELFDSAYLTWRYRNEFEMSEMPGFVKKVIVPLTYFVGLMLGKYRKFDNAPQPL